MPDNKKKSKSTNKPSRKTKTRSSNASKPKKRKIRKAKRSGKSKNIFFKRTLLVPFFLVGAIIFVSYLVYLDQRITERFEGRIWQLPAHVYARPLELFVGKSISVKQLQFELEYLNYQKVEGLPQKSAEYRNWNNTFELKTRSFVFWDGNEPSHTIRAVINDNVVTNLIDIYTNKSADLVRFDAGYLTGIFPSHSQDRILLKLDDVPDMFIKMLLLIEDRRFFTHWGVDPKSIARALVANISSGGTVQGGSTLTQQLVKNLFLSQEKKLTRKINEAFMSLLLEGHYDKKLILETYLNEIYLGQDGRRAIHGFGLASKFYFGKELKKLSIDQMAILVGMVKGASYYNPKRNPEHAAKRRNVVLATMQGAELITPRQAENFSNKPVITVKHARSGRYPAFIDVVKLQLQQDYQSDDLSSEGLRVFTTLDPYIQFKTEEAIKTTLPLLSKNEKLQAAAIVVSPLNGDVLAVVGDRNPSFKGFNRAINAERQIGSLIKPVIYLTAIESDLGYTLASILDDSEFIYPNPDRNSTQPDWQPLNYDKKYHGDVTLYESLLKSYNVPAARTGINIGLNHVVDTISALGVNKKIPAYPSLALGAVTLSPMQVASIYQSLAANGFHSPLRSVSSVLDKNKQPLERYSLEVESQVRPEAVALINSALIDVTKYGTAKRLSDTMTVQVAGKTGTSDDLRDSWFAGFSGDVVAVVWTGYDDNSPTRLTGSSGAMKIWQKMVEDVAYKSYFLPEMSQLKRYWIDTNNGLLAENSCENAVQLLFIEGTQPDQQSDCDFEDNTNDSGNWFINLFN
ncbi:Multimodular transpeptidase-transglycosylase [hydrothermal vent metagenome]|uniref:Penicillin-binding protein 1B n=1 Tax=hydrothermal vent metagenome TaxID=652676 RepID=A0A3B0WYJ2_9ZZZZ